MVTDVHFALVHSVLLDMCLLLFSNSIFFRYWAPTDWTDYNYTITDNVIYHSGQKRAGLSESEGGVVNCNSATSCMKVKTLIYNERRKYRNKHDSSLCLW